MRFKTCSCDKDTQKCIKTGFKFLHLDTGLVRNGDLFLCDHCGTLSIHGIPEGAWPIEKWHVALPVSVYCGDLIPQYAKYTMSACGICDLTQADIDYVAEYHDLMPYALKESDIAF